MAYRRRIGICGVVCPTHLGRTTGVHDNAAPETGSEMWTRKRGEQDYISNAALCARGRMHVTRLFSEGGEGVAPV